jgi:hypothetical protein
MPPSLVVGGVPKLTPIQQFHVVAEGPVLKGCAP